jgi:hypothetical protein
MGKPFSWSCPYCNQATTITDINTDTKRHEFNHLNKEGDLALLTQVIVCPNPECRECEIYATLYKLKKVTQVNAASYMALIEPALMVWKLKPKSGARPFPAYIPKPVLADYNEACLIVDDSPKASATLSRRCLQGMIRDFWGIKDKTLALEINALQGKIDPTTWAAIDAVRGVGNIGAHMEKDINLIVDVESEEAQQLIGLIEFLLKDWYVGRHEREEHKRRVIALGAAKAAAKQGTPPSP